MPRPLLALILAALAPALSAGPAAAAEPAAASAVQYALEPARSALFVQVFKDTDSLAARLSHDHVVAATGWTGSVRWDAADPSRCKVDFRVPVAGLRVDDDALRTRVGYDTMLTADQRAEVTSNMLGTSQLDAASFSVITFAAAKCEAAGQGVRVTGNLTVHGVAAPVSGVFAITADGASFAAKGNFEARASQFGFQPYTALMGALRNQDEMTFTVDVRGSATSAGSAGGTR